MPKKSCSRSRLNTAALSISRTSGATRCGIDKMGPIFVQVYGMTECLVCTILKAHHHLLDAPDAERREGVP